MSLETALEANTAAIRELIETLKGGAPVAPGGNAPTGSTAAEHAAKKLDTEQDVPATSAKPGAVSASTRTKSSDAPKAAAWHEKTAALYEELKDEEPTLDNVRKAILGINKEIGREQADAVLAHFGAQAVSTKADKKGLDPKQFGEFFALCLDVLAGHTDATQSMTE